MAHIIEDGTGQGFNAKVNSDNELHVKPFPIDIHSRSQITGRAYSVYYKRDVATANTEEPLGVLEYNGSGRLVMSQLNFSIAITDMVDTQGGRIEVHLINNTAGISGGTARTPIPMNRGLQVASDSIATSGEGTLISGFSIDATSEIFHTYLRTDGQGNWEWKPGDSYLMEKGDAIIITAKGYTSGTALPGFRCTLRMFEEDLDTL